MVDWHNTYIYIPITSASRVRHASQFDWFCSTTHFRSVSQQWIPQQFQSQTASPITHNFSLLLRTSFTHSFSFFPPQICHLYAICYFCCKRMLVFFLWRGFGCLIFTVTWRIRICTSGVFLIGKFKIFSFIFEMIKPSSFNTKQYMNIFIWLNKQKKDSLNKKLRVCFLIVKILQSASYFDLPSKFILPCYLILTFRQNGTLLSAGLPYYYTKIKWKTWICPFPNKKRRGSKIRSSIYS